MQIVARISAAQSGDRLAPNRIAAKTPDFASLIGATRLRCIIVRYRRHFVAGGTYFFTVTLADRRSRALTDNVAALRECVRAVRRSRPFTIDAVVVLPDHLHMVMALPEGDVDFSGRWRAIKQRFTARLLAGGADIAANAAGERALWQRRFWEHTIRDDGDLARHVDYVHVNPVKHGLVGRVRDWPYSSFHRYVHDGVLPVDWAGDAGGADGRFGER